MFDKSVTSINELVHVNEESNNLVWLNLCLNFHDLCVYMYVCMDMYMILYFSQTYKFFKVFHQEENTFHLFSVIIHTIEHHKIIIYMIRDS